MKTLNIYEIGVDPLPIPNLAVWMFPSDDFIPYCSIGIIDAPPELEVPPGWAWDVSADEEVPIGTHWIYEYEFVASTKSAEDVWFPFTNTLEEFETAKELGLFELLNTERMTHRERSGAEYHTTLYTCKFAGVVFAVKFNNYEGRFGRSRRKG